MDETLLATDPVLLALERIGNGASVRDAAKAARMPLTTLFDRLASPAHAEQYARARESQAEVHADRIASLADDVLAGTYDAQSGRVAIDALKWVASKLKPKVYGDRIEVSGKQDVTVTISLGAPLPNQLAPNIEREVASAAPRVIEAQLVEAKGAPTARQRRKRKGGPKGA